MYKFIETKHGKIALSFEFKNIIIRISGGLDSATLLCALCDHIERNQLDGYRIIPLTVTKVGNKDKKSMYDKRDLFPVAQTIIDYATTRYPNVEIEMPEFYSIYDWWEDDKKYVDAQNDGLHDICDKYNCFDDHISYNGITKNPDIDVSSYEPNPERHRQTIRNDDVIEGTVSRITKWKSTGKHWLVEAQPYRNADKRIVFSLADILGVREDLEEIAISCEGTRRMTENFKKRCIDVPENKTDYICWWCLERKWAKETYDR